MNKRQKGTAIRRQLLVSASLLAALLVPFTLAAEPPPLHEPKAALCVSELCKGDSMQQVLQRNMHKRVELVLRSGKTLTGTVNEISGGLVQLINLTHRNFYDAVVDLKEIGAVVMRVRNDH